jgi:GTP pyrophosphokinase
MVTKAYEVAKLALEGIFRSDGSPFIHHAETVAAIIENEIGLTGESVAGMYLHEATREAGELTAQIKKDFPSEVINIAESLNKISSIKPKETGLQAENYRKLIVSYSADPRVTLIKLADRLEIMRNLDHFTKNKQIAKATETLLLYAPLAHQLGLYNLKSEMEELSFKYTEPEQYRLINNKLKTTEKERERLMRSFVRPLEAVLKADGIVYTLKSRTKTSYSIWKKMQVQQIPFEAIADIFAIRFIIESDPENEKDLCWKVYSRVTEYYTPDTSRLRDWITMPKPNGYESLHTTVSNAAGDVVEVQIRTRRMDEIAESGHASHWSYKGVKQEVGLDTWLQGVKKLLEASGKSGYADAAIFNLSLNEIFVFTPDGDLRRLSAGASVLDFAFDIHTNLGLKCAGAKINGKPASIRERLRTGDVVEIMSNKNQKPSMDWLNFVITSKARAKIKQKLNEEESKRAAIGRELLVRRMNNWKIELNDERLQLIIKNFKFKTVPEFYSALATGDLDIADVKLFLNDKLAQPVVSEQKDVPGTPVMREEKQSGSKSDYLIIDDKLNNVGYKLSKCCNPIHGDEVFGFVSVKEGIKIHRLTCPNASRLISNYPYRIQKVKWREEASGQIFQTSLRISGYGESKADREIVETVGQFPVSLRFFSINDSGGKFEAKLQIAVPNNQILDKLIFSLKKIKGVKSVSRVSNG